MEAIQTPYHEATVERFRRLMESGRLAHAYLFVGPQDVGKSETAVAVAKLVNCEERKEGQLFCNACPACRKIDSLNHPDVFIIEPDDGQTIKIAKVRELIGQVQMRPFEAAQKVFIIKEVDRLTLESGHALLKTLEEPAANSILILTTSVPEKLLSTVRSRCHMVSFFPLSAEALSRQLQETYHLDAGAAHFLAHFAEGCSGKAKQLNGLEFFVRKNEMVDNMVFLRNNETYLKGVLADKMETQEVLGVLLTWFRDVMLVKVGVPQERLAHFDRYEDVAKSAKQYSMKQLKDIVEEIVNTIKMLGENLNVKIPMALLKEKIWVK